MGAPAGDQFSVGWVETRPDDADDFMRAIVDLAAERPYRTVLDLGTGTGRMLHLLSGDQVGDHDALFRAFVRKHRAAHDIATGKHTGDGRHLILVDHDIAPLVDL